MARTTTTKTKVAAAKAAAAKDQLKSPPELIIADETSVAAANASEDQTAEPSTMDKSAGANDDEDDDDAEKNTKKPLKGKRAKRDAERKGRKTKAAKKAPLSDSDDESLFNTDHDDDDDDNDPDNDKDGDGSEDESSDEDESVEPQAPMNPAIKAKMIPHWSGFGHRGQTNSRQEAAVVLKAIGATQTVATFWVNDGVDTISEIQQLTKETIGLFAKTCRKNLRAGHTVSTRFILDLKRLHSS